MTERSNNLDDLASLAGVVILAGGASRRMGTPKAMLTLPSGEQLLDYHVRHASRLQASILIADNERGFQVGSDINLENPNSPVIYISDYGSDSDESGEQTPTRGALVAIESALQTLIGLNDSDISKTKNETWLLVISCDSLIPATDLWHVLQQSAHHAPDKKIICLEDDNHLYPLLGLYQLSIEPSLKGYLDSGQRRVMQFIEPIVQPVPFITAWQNLTNFNTPEDFERACAAMPKYEKY